MNNFRISRLEVNNIGPFGHLVMDFPEKPPGMDEQAEIHILTGENGTGKTTVLEMLVLGVMVDKNEALKSNKFRLADKKSNAVVYFGPHGSYSFDGEDKYLPLGFTAKLYSIASKETPIGRYHSDSNVYSTAFFAYSGYRRTEQVEITENPEIQGHPFENALDFKHSINPRKIINWIASAKINEALAVSQSDAREAQNFREAVIRIEKVIGEIIEKPIQFKLEYKPRKVIIEVAGETLDFNILPDGLKSIVSWIADLLMRMDRVKWENDTPVFERNFILFLDEIEVHLHPAWQRKILPAVQKLFPNAQIFISTHSPFVVGSVDGAWIHKFVKPNGDSQLAGPPILSEDAKSFRYWLDEVFDIKKEFGEGAQRQLDRFYELRNRLLVNGTAQEREEFTRIATDLSSQSREMESIISLELRQLNKRIQEPLEI